VERNHLCYYMTLLGRLAPRAVAERL
jgi:hypothetical protein